MRKQLAAITGIQGYVPPTVITNADMEKLVDTNDEWIFSRTGIRERRIVDKGWATSDMALIVAQGLLEKTGTHPEELDMLIIGTVSPDTVFPDTANTVLSRLGATNAFGFDVSAACSGFLYTLHLGTQYIMAGTHKKVMIIGADTMSQIINYKDRTTCILFGDGAGGVMLEPATDDNGVIDGVLKADGSGRELLYMKAGGSRRPASHQSVENGEHSVYQEGKHVFKYAVRGMSGACREVAERNNLSLEDVQWLVPHQANMRIIAAVGEELGIPAERVMVNIEKYGNTTAGTIPLCLWELEPKLKKGDNLLLTSFGGGFTWGAIYVRWSI
jgi:3-oxoacyl-[acyl-carrier-protein] synthase III